MHPVRDAGRKCCAGRTSGCSDPENSSRRSRAALARRRDCFSDPAAAENVIPRNLRGLRHTADLRFGERYRLHARLFGHGIQPVERLAFTSHANRLSPLPNRQRSRQVKPVGHCSWTFQPPRLHAHRPDDNPAGAHNGGFCRSPGSSIRSLRTSHHGPNAIPLRECRHRIGSGPLREEEFDRKSRFRRRFPANGIPAAREISRFRQPSRASCAAASRAMGIRRGEQLT